MSVRSHIYASVVLPLAEGYRYRGLWWRMQQGLAAERESLAANTERQWRSWQRLMEHAFLTVPFYRDRLKAVGITPQGIRTPADLVHIPYLTREDLRANFDALISTDYVKSDLLEAATGGTTDTPVAILRSPECLPEKVANQAQFNSWAGVFPGDKVFWLWGAQSDFAANPSWRWRLFDRYIMRREWAPTSLLNEKVMAEHASRLDRFQPDAIMAYPTPLAIFSEYLLASNYRGALPRTAVCTAEPLLPDQRAVIERALGCRVFEHYGTRDFGLVAGECQEHSGLHVHPEAVYIELIPIQGDENGLHELIVTDLLNRAFPLIRYKINDCVYPRPSQCPCGRGFPLINKIEGRVTDNFHLPNGDMVPGVSLTNRVIKTASGIRKIQVIQETPATFTVNYVEDAGFTSASLDSLKAKLVEFLGGEVAISFHCVVDIPRERSGKTRVCISRVSPELRPPPRLPRAEGVRAESDR
jgi:phenylacetate-CoA ligase